MATAKENETRAREAYAAFAAGDLDKVKEVFHPDLVWHMPGSSPLAGEYRGIDAVLGFFGTLFSETGRDVVLGVNVARQAEAARSAPPELLYQVFTVDNARVINIHVYPDRASALTHPTREEPPATTRAPRQGDPWPSSFTTIG